MTVRDLIIKLLEFNLDADITVIAHNQQQPYSISWSGADGSSKESCIDVGFYCDELNQSESDAKQ